MRTDQASQRRCVRPDEPVLMGSRAHTCGEEWRNAQEFLQLGSAMTSMLHVGDLAHSA